MFELLSWLSRILLRYRGDQRPTVSRSEVQFPLEETPRRRKSAPHVARFRKLALSGKLDVSRSVGRDELLGVLEASLKLRNAIMSRHFCHRRWPIIE